MTQEKQGERAKWLSFWRKVVIAAIGCIAVVGVGVMLWKVTHKESEEARMRRLVERLAAEETEIRMFDMLLYLTDRRREVREDILAHGKRAVPFLIEGLHHEHGVVSDECALLLSEIPTKEGIAALIRCLGEGEKPVPRPFEVHCSLVAITGYTGRSGSRELRQRTRQGEDTPSVGAVVGGLQG